MRAARSCPSCGLRVMLAALSWRRSRARLLLRACIRRCSGGAQSLAYVRTGCAPGDVRAVLGRIGGDAARSGSCVRVRRRAPGDVRALLGCVVGNVRAARMPRVEEAQHTPALVHVSMTPRRQHKHTTDRVCACAPGKEQTALVVRARLGIIAVEKRQRTAEPVYVHRLRSGSCSGVCPPACSCSHARRRTW